MENQYFQNECIKYLTRMFEAFDQSKSVIKEILSEFHRVCEKNNIRYYVSFGSLLGYERDNLLMPPWDRDIDTVIFFEDKELLIEALINDLGEKYSFECDGNKKRFPYYQMHIYHKDYDPEIYHVDVFYLVSSVNKFRDHAKWKRKVIKLYNLRKHKYAPIPKRFGMSMKRIFKLYRFVYSLYPSFIMSSMFKKICKHYEGNYCGIIGFGAEIFPKAVFGEGKTVSCEGIAFRIPNNADEFLKIRYGNYKEYLPIEKRFEEFLSGVNAMEE